MSLKCPFYFLYYVEEEKNILSRSKTKKNLSGKRYGLYDMDTNDWLFFYISNFNPLYGNEVFLNQSRKKNLKLHWS